jgi:DeoR family transcriptional regulator, suf operon transcriptional repressor
MQETRRYILDILNDRGQATVDDIVADLRERKGDITAVTVRHHLTRLQQEHLITTPELLHRTTPGRPQYVYSLTEKAREYFPNNYVPLTTYLLGQISEILPPSQVNVILEGVADRMASEAGVSQLPVQMRLEKAVDYLNQHGYDAYWEACDGGFVLHTANCPYHQVAETTHALCEMDMRLIASILGVVPRLLSRVSSGDATCAYMIPMGN